MSFFAFKTIFSPTTLAFSAIFEALAILLFVFKTTFFKILPALTVPVDSSLVLYERISLIFKSFSDER